ncbi:MAG TPA: mannitol dehydrogenase family protein [Polyangiaceae bacterium]|nr:mannitol dehydrogenase family protein [Polyangiaceae bacterium]
MRRPHYDRAAVTEGVLHFGVGNFHRSHQAPYFEEAMETTGASDWGICGVGVLPADRSLHAALAAQDGLYALVEKNDEQRSVRVVGSLVRHVLARVYPETVFEALARPATKLVTLTITEGGYCSLGAAGLDFGHPDIQHDLRRRWRPKTVYGYLAEGLDRRRLRGLSPVPVVSCDNVPENGVVLRRALVDFASARSAELGRWLDENGCFPSSMVDRITPPASESDRDHLLTEYGIDDACPVVCEPFRQWVLEDCFEASRPPLDAVGVHYTNDIKPYQETKIRLLNGTHSAMGYLGYLGGYRFVHEVMSAPEFQPYLDGLMDDEVSPLLRSLPGLHLDEYKASLRGRFANRALVDPLLRVCADGSAKIPKFVLPSIRDQLARDGPIANLCLCVAGWLRFLDGTDEQGNPIPVMDPGAGRLVEAVRTNRGNAEPALRVQEIFGDLGGSARFSREVSHQLRALYERGARELLAG